MQAENARASIMIKTLFPAGFLLKVGSWFALSAMVTLYPILAELSMEKGTYSYNIVTVPLLSEAIKLFVSIMALSCEGDISRCQSEDLSWLINWKYAILAILYTAQNNLIFLTIKHVDPGSYQILSNSKMVITAILMSVILHKRFVFREICGILLLTAGPIISQLSTEESNMFKTSFTGFCLVMLMVLISSSAGVFNEKFLKDATLGSIHWQNSQLYAFGLFFNFFYCVLVRSLSQGLSGYNLYTWLSVLNLALMGLSIGFVLKYSDNIVRLLSSITAMMGATLFSSLYMQVDIATFHVLGLTISIIGMIIYSYTS
jgi:drug/metabolite transporter (DMT)-like permease